MAKKPEKKIQGKAVENKVQDIQAEIAIDEADFELNETSAKTMGKKAKIGTPDYRATAEKNKNPKKKKSKGKDSGKKNIFQRMWASIKGTFSELKKVSWPKGKTVASNTMIVLLVVVLFLIVIFLFDYVLSGLLSLLLGNGWTNIFG